METSINTRYLELVYLKRYQKIAQTVERTYLEVFNSVKEHLAYAPIVYVIPYVLEDTQRMGNKSIYRAFFNMNYFDPDDFNRRAIFSTIEFFEKFSKYIPAGFGHELAHQISEGDRRLTRKDLQLQLDDPLGAIKAQESRKKAALTLFPKDLRDLIEEWDTLSSQKTTVQTLLNGAWKVPMYVFEEQVFGDRFVELKSFIMAKGKEALESDD